MNSVLRSMLFDKPRRAAVASGPTYAEFLAHINAKESPTTVTWDNFTGFSTGAYVSTAIALGGAMYGTPYNSFIYNSAAPGRIIQHSVGSAAQINAIVSNGRRCWFRLTNAGSQTDFFGIDRNGYLSLDLSGSGDQAYYCNLVIVWIEGVGPMQGNPQTGGALTPYTWP